MNLTENNWSCWITLETTTDRPQILHGLLCSPRSNTILIPFRYAKKGKFSFSHFSFSRVSAFTDSRGTKIRRQKKDRFSFPVFFSQLTQKKGAPQFRTQEPFLEDFHFTASDSDTSGEAANWANPNSTRTTQDFPFVWCYPVAYMLQLLSESIQFCWENCLSIVTLLCGREELGQDRGSHRNFCWLIIWPQKSKVKIQALDCKCTKESTAAGTWTRFAMIFEIRIAGAGEI